jgi:hypothetical protein
VTRLTTEPTAEPSAEQPAGPSTRPDADEGRGLSPVGSRLLTATLVLSALAFVVVTVGSSLIGSTSFYAGGLLVNNKPWISAGEQPVEVTNNWVGDTIDYFIPGRSQIVDRVRDGDIPGWNPLQGAGAALGSIPTYGLLAPTSVAWWVLPHDLAPGWEKLTVLVLATAGTALFLRRLGTGRHAAWLGGMIYASSGFMIGWTSWPQADVAAMIPWLLWSTERALQLRSWRAQVPVALAVGFLLLGGFPAVTGHALYATAGFVLLRLATRAVDDGRRVRAALADMGRLLVGLVTGFLLASVQLATFVYTLLDLDTSYREGGFGMTVPLRMAFGTVFPNGWGTRAGEHFFLETNPIEASNYIGAAAAVLAVVAMLMRPRRSVPRGVRTYFAAVVAVSALLIYVQGPLLEWVGALPVFSGNPIGRLTSVLLMAAAVLAGLGFDAALAARERTTVGTALRLLVGLGVTLGALAGMGLWLHRQSWQLLGAPRQKEIVTLAVACACLAAGAVLLAHLRPSWRAATLLVVPVVVGVQGIAAATPMWSQVDRDTFFPTTPVHEYLLAHQGTDRMAVAGTPSNRVMANGSTAYYGIRSITGHVFPRPEFGELEAATCPTCGLSPTYWVLPSQTELPLWQSPGLDRMAVRYITADPEWTLPGTPEQVVAGDQVRPLPLAEEEPMTVPIAGGPLRGLTLDYRSGPAEATSGDLVVEVLDEAGNVLVSTRRLVQFGRPVAPLNVPIAGEDLPPGGTFTVRLHWAGPSAPPAVAADGDGRPTLSVVRPADDGLRLAFAGGAVVWERLTALPRIRWASRTEVIPSESARIDAVTHGRPGEETVVLDAPGKATEGGSADVTVLEDSGDRTTARVDAQGAGYLVVADSVQEDWTATVDGVEQPIVPADHAFGAVHVPAGTHEVSWEYTPRGATAGLIATGVGLVALALMCLPAWRRRRESAEAWSPAEAVVARRPSPGAMAGATTAGATTAGPSAAPERPE